MVHVNALVQGKWPPNYSVNMSNDSIYASVPRVRDAMFNLPVTRGFFNVVPLASYIKELDRNDPNQKFSPPPLGFIPFPYDEKRVRTFLALNHLSKLSLPESIAQAHELLPGLLEEGGIPAGKDAPASALEVREFAIRWYLGALCKNPEFLRAVEVEMLKDMGMTAPERTAHEQRELERLKRELSETEFQQEYLKRERRAYERVRKEEQARELERQQASYDKKLKKGTLKPGAKRPEKRPERTAESEIEDILSLYGKDTAERKTFALLLMEVYWSLDLGGSCPLLCGNCSDLPFAGTGEGYHRCASKGVFRGKNIHIGLH
jgi:hypothetical protein